jgi:hypothetical protein
MTTCRYCHRTIVQEDGAWIDPEATGDDAIWRETCDAHDTFEADHEPDDEDPFTYQGTTAADVAQRVRIDDDGGE